MAESASAIVFGMRFPSATKSQTTHRYRFTENSLSNQTNERKKSDAILSGTRPGRCICGDKNVKQLNYVVSYYLICFYVVHAIHLCRFSPSLSRSSFLSSFFFWSCFYHCCWSGFCLMISESDSLKRSRNENEITIELIST